MTEAPVLLGNGAPNIRPSIVNASGPDDGAIPQGRCFILPALFDGHDDP